jgi:hypothetical protein
MTEVREMKKAILLMCCIVMPICLAACGMFPVRPVAQPPANEPDSADIAVKPEATPDPLQASDIKAGTLASCQEWSAVFDSLDAVVQSDPVGPYALSLSYDGTAQGHDPVTGAAIQGATVVSVNGSVACRCEWGTEVTAITCDLTNDGVEELLLILCPIMDNAAHCDVHVFSIDATTGKAVETLTLAGGPSSAFIDRSAKSYLHIPDDFDYPVNAVTTSGVNEFCAGVDIMETEDAQYLRILHGIYPDGYDRTGFTAYSYVMWNGGWNIFGQETTLN